MTEISGIAPAPGQPDHHWVNNDSGDGSRLYLLAPDGRVRAVLQVRGADSEDWEDLSLGPGPGATADSPGGLPWLYIADTGNNTRSRKRLTLYRVPAPELTGVAFGATVRSAKAERLEFSYPDHARDCEALVVTKAVPSAV